jgi:hypothetical protein
MKYAFSIASERPLYTRFAPLVFAAALLGQVTNQAQVNRPASGPRVPTKALAGLSVQDMTGTVTPASLVQALVGPSVSVSNVVYTGASFAAGTFVGGTGIVGFEQGILLGSGCVTNVIGPNTSDSVSCVSGTPGDPDLGALIPGYQTFDAAVLEFDFQCPTTTAVSFQYVFSSDEYNEWVNTDYNDVFGFFLNGANIALVPGAAGVPVSINNVNCNNPFAPPSGSHCGVYVNNDLDDGGGAIDTEMDGLTVLFTATGVLQPGLNHIKLAISDAGDQVYDSNVFLRGQSFTCGSGGTDPVFDPPTPCGEDFNVDAGQAMSFPVVALATNGLPGAFATLTASGVPSGAYFTPALPTSGQPAAATFHWTPTNADLGPHTITLTATDQTGAQKSCPVVIEVHPFCALLAESSRLGAACGASLVCEPPQFGHQTSVDVLQAAPFSPGVVMYSATGAVPLPIEGCLVYLNVAAMLPLKKFVTDDVGDYGFKFTVAGSPSLCGAQLVLQGAVINAGGPLSFGSITNAVLVKLGS